MEDKLLEKIIIIWTPAKTWKMTPPNTCNQMQQFHIKAQRYCDLGLPNDGKYYKTPLKSTQNRRKVAEGPKTASHQESLQNRSKSTLCAHTLQCSSQKRFPKIFFEITLMSRDRVQSILFWHHNFDFRSGFATGFESTTKPQREAQKCQAECTIRALSRCL